LNRINDQITAPELRVIDESGKNLGVLPKEQALALAKERGLDLIEVAPQATPPVAKIMSFDKFRYQKEKERKKQERAKKGPGLKQIRLSARSAKNDLEIKARKVNEFLNKGHKVEIMMVLRGREKEMKDWARQKMLDFLTIVGPNHKVIVEPKPGGRGLVMQIGR
jgi:translation initiation factor IF-3